MTATARKFLIFLSFAVSPAMAGNITPIFLADGTQRMVCSGSMNYMFTQGISNKVLVGAYLFANLVTPVSAGGMDMSLVATPQYGTAPLADLHIFPAIPNGNRQGESRTFFPGGDGILLNGIIQVAAECWGGGYAEIYVVIYVRDP